MRTNRNWNLNLKVANKFGWLESRLACVSLSSSVAWNRTKKLTKAACGCENAELLEIDRRSLARSIEEQTTPKTSVFLRKSDDRSRDEQQQKMPA
jgi:hypothetical protein